MVLPSRLGSRGAMGTNVIGGGIPLGLSASILPALPTAAGALAPGFLEVCASKRAPARIAGDIPSSDNNFRLFTVLLSLNIMEQISNATKSLLHPLVDRNTHRSERDTSEIQSPCHL